MFFQLRQNRIEYFLFDTRYDQRVSGFILCEDDQPPKTPKWTLTNISFFAGLS